MKTSDLQRTLLVFISEKPYLAKDLLEKLTKSRIWNTSRQQMYGELKILEKKGYLDSAIVYDSQKSPSKQYSITQDGESVVRETRGSTTITTQFKFHSESTMMLKAGNIHYFYELSAHLTRLLEEAYEEQKVLVDPIERLLLDREITYFKSEYDYAVSAIHLIKSCKQNDYS
ncbi:PadR family transcriptional regulator (plasmid) [Photobacterium sp. CCB-ST2H9]|uniref:PadR family transcriptional regulator n=1 Tax=Photobacterium sp. CCB-ST2H9 TaxID=2912855 RepID=UPI002002D0B8|nr:PadR family transcriptional regulator [Photobacterium sp. CCB-ST2H9]UTM60432.1 PadR family transcriptional regulator [Photobacterium sp. CCB-ST2H9]